MEEREERKCFKCGVSEKKEKLLDAISKDEIVKACEYCVRVEELPVIMKPSPEQLSKSEKPYTVKERLSKLTGVAFKEEDERRMEEKITLDSLRKSKIGGNKEISAPINLIDNFHWYIQRERRRRGLTQRQLAEEIAESETLIKNIEKGELPQNISPIKKIEQFLRIKLLKDEEKAIDWYTLKKDKEKKLVEVVGKTKEKEEEKPILNFIDKSRIESLSIKDLRKMREEILRNEEGDTEIEEIDTFEDEFF